MVCAENIWPRSINIPNVILYASGWLQRNVSSENVSIGDEDIHALMEVTYSLSGDTLDLILHSPGGSPEAAGSVVSYLVSAKKLEILW